jgi:hypothetical protein
VLPLTDAGSITAFEPLFAPAALAKSQHSALIVHPIMKSNLGF